MDLRHLNHLLCPVEKVKSEELFPGYEFTPQQAYTVVVKERNKKLIVNHCSKQYHLVPNAEIIKPLAKIFSEDTIEIVGTERFGSRFSFDILFKEDTINVGTKDPIIPRLRINNSYDGRVKYSFILGFYRMICSNGMVIPAEGFEEHNVEIKMRHTPSLGEYVEEELLTGMIQDFKSGIKNFSKPYVELQKKKVKSLEDIVQDVIDSTKFPSRRGEEVMERIVEEQGQTHTKQLNAWLVYNGFNYQLNHSEDIKMDEHKKERIDQQVLTHLLQN